MKYNPESIFTVLPGETNPECKKIAQSRIFQFEIQGSKYSNYKNEIDKGVFERNMSYFIVVYKDIINRKGLGLSSNYCIFMWRGEDGLNITKNAIEKFITTPFKQNKIADDSSTSRKKKASVLVGGGSSLLKRQPTLVDKARKIGSFNVNDNVQVSYQL